MRGRTLAGSGRLQVTPIFPWHQGAGPGVLAGLHEALAIPAFTAHLRTVAAESTAQRPPVLVSVQSNLHAPAQALHTRASPVSLSETRAIASRLGHTLSHTDPSKDSSVSPKATCGFSSGNQSINFRCLLTHMPSVALTTAHGNRETNTHAPCLSPALLRKGSILQCRAKPVACTTSARSW